MSYPPSRQGLYDPRNEHDACGMGFVVDLNGNKSHEIIRKGIEILVNLTHRGACGCDPETGDGAGILIQIPHEFFVRECRDIGFSLPEPGVYGVGMMFLPVEPQQRLMCEGIVERIAREEGLTVLGWRDTPIDSDAIGRTARATQPYIEQVFLRGAHELTQDELERVLYVVRRRAETEVAATDIREKDFFYVPSLSTRLIVYKGLLLAPQISEFYKELSDPDTRSALCMVHQRFSTNTFPTWQLAHPFRMICHNGEINTVKGNVNWMHARESVLKSNLFGDDLEKMFPVIRAGLSDTGSLDNAVEMLTLAGRELPHVMAMLMPEAWDADSTMLAREARVLRIPRVADGALGRPRRGGVHRRQVAGRDARPQRSASGAVSDHQGRSADPGLGNRGSAGEAGRGGIQGPAPARQDAAGGSARTSAWFRMRRSSTSWPRASLTASGWRRTRSRSMRCPILRASTAPIRRPCCNARGPSVIPKKICAS